MWSQEIIKIQLSDSVNTDYIESKPMISPDGKTLYFARQNAPGNINGKDDDQDIYYSTYGADGWSKAKNIGEPLNNAEPNGIVAIAPTGKSIYMLNAYTENSNQDGIAVSKQNDTSWTKPAVMPINDFQNLSPYIDYFYTSNGQELIAAVERDDSYGDQDLYVSTKLPNGGWSSPINLGDVINTKKAEFSPFLAADNKTLFFASMGHKNYGSADIFYSKRLDATWTNWSEPENLGTDVNSKSFEAYYSIPTNGTIGYYVSDKNGKDKSRDIFSITIPYQFRPDPVILLSGKFLVAHNNDDSIEYNVNFLTTSTSESEVFVEYEAKSFNAILPTGGSYFFYVSKTGFISESHYIDLTNQTEFIEETADIHSVPIKSGEAFTSHNIQFNQGTDEFANSAYFELVRLSEIFSRHDKLQIAITAHAHDFDDSLKNKALSERRVNKIAAFYIEQGFDAERIEIIAAGDSFQSTDDYKKHINSEFNVNNRVDFEILDTDWSKAKALALKESEEKNLVNEKNKVKQYSLRILFDFDDAQVRSNNEALDSISTILNNRLVDSIALVGYTCDIGDAAYNKYLAQKRANAVKNWLLRDDLKESDISVASAGENKPLNENANKTQRAMNRRVEVLLISSKKDKSITYRKYFDLNLGLKKDVIVYKD